MQSVTEARFGRAQLLSRTRRSAVLSGFDFVSLDVETANYSRGSVCSIGYAVVRDGARVEQGSGFVAHLRRSVISKASTCAYTASHLRWLPANPGSKIDWATYSTE